jgi:hypothetical protein
VASAPSMYANAATPKVVKVVVHPMPMIASHPLN